MILFIIVALNLGPNCEAASLAKRRWLWSDHCTNSFLGKRLKPRRRCGMDLPCLFFVCIRRAFMRCGKLISTFI